MIDVLEKKRETSNQASDHNEEVHKMRRLEDNKVEL